MIYGEAIDYIRNIERAGSDYGIERMRELLVLLGNPDKRLKFVHVAGTNGKGSVCAYLTSALKAAGYKVGTYNSPSVFCYNERWLLDGTPLDDAGVAKYLTVVKDAIDKEKPKSPDFQPTAFEIETAVALLAFCENECDICVLETGLGGRWDATNVIYEKELAVITPIALDHCALLGNTLAEIASEKAAIIKDDAVTCAQCDEIMRELYHPYVIADGLRIAIDANVTVCAPPSMISCDLSGQVFEYDGDVFKIVMLGEHQLVNAAIAVCALKKLREKKWNISDNDIKSGLEKTVWRARFEIVKNAKDRFSIDIPQDKTLVFDGAHNPQGADALAKCISQYLENKRVHIVAGMLKDKDVDGAVSRLAPLAKRVTAVTPESPRALDKETLAQKFRIYCRDVDACDNIKSAVQNALFGDCDAVVLCGSLTLFGSL